MTHRFITTGKLLASSLIISLAFSSTAMAQAKSTSTAPEVTDAIKPANTYGATRSNRSSNIAAPSGETPDVGDALPNATSYGSTRNNKQQGGGIVAPTGETSEELTEKLNADGTPYKLGKIHLNLKTIAPEQKDCVTVSGTTDINCDVEARRLPTGQNNVLARSAPVEGKQDVEDATASEKTTRESLKTFSRNSKQIDEAEGLFSRRSDIK